MRLPTNLSAVSAFQCDQNSKFQERNSRACLKYKNIFFQLEKPSVEIEDEKNNCQVFLYQEKLENMKQEKIT
jgi:hypothetical protein